MKEVILIGCSINWLVRYDENGEAVGKYIGISIQSTTKEVDGKRIGTKKIALLAFHVRKPF